MTLKTVVDEDTKQTEGSREHGNDVEDIMNKHQTLQVLVEVSI